MEKETIKEKVLRRLKLYTMDEVKDREEKLVRAWERELSSTKEEKAKEIETLKVAHKEELDSLKKDYKDLQKMKSEEVKRLQDRIEELDLQNKSYIDEINIKSSEIANLNMQNESLKEEMSHMVKYEVLKPDRAKSNQKRKVKSSSVKSKIARNTVKELEEVTDE